jgi:hypothetical protein
MQDIEKWPLVHGSYRLHETWKDIRENGLFCPGKYKATNSYPYDDALGRTSYVYLSLLRRNLYGMGQFILVDPAVVSLPGSKASLFDAAARLRQFIINCEWDNGPSHFPEWILEPERLQMCISQCEAYIEESKLPPGVLWSDIESVLRQDLVGKYVFETQAFREYFELYYPSIPSFFAEMKKLTPKTEEEFLHRYGDEEVLIYNHVPPNYLIGYWQHGAWSLWNLPFDEKVWERVEKTLDFLGELRRCGSMK